jgi:cobalt-precorrin-6B (C15)-methyltransferase
MLYLKDEEFIRGNCPMTKEEVRIVSISKLGIEKGCRALDIGAGTGSVAIQMALISEIGEVIAIEKDEEALEVLYKNKEKFNACNLNIIPSEAVEAEVFGEFDAVFVGGSGGNIEVIIEKYSAKLKPGKNMVLNFITIDNLYRASEELKALNYEVECIQLAISKTKGRSYMLMANNPIFILTAVKRV